jgi:peptide deformylase
MTIAPEKLAKLKIVRYGHGALRQKARPVGRGAAELEPLVERMAELMRAANGLGLAANQVGLPLRVAVIQHEGRLIVLVDPQIIKAKGSETADEGCLSLPRLYGEVTRPAEVWVAARDLSGKRIKLHGEGMLARALCHEVDHLDGRLFVDQVDESTLHWLIRRGAPRRDPSGLVPSHDGSDEEEPVVQATTLEDALKLFLSSHRGGEG